MLSTSGSVLHAFCLQHARCDFNMEQRTNVILWNRQHRPLKCFSKPTAMKQWASSPSWLLHYHGLAEAFQASLLPILNCANHKCTCARCYKTACNMGLGIDRTMSRSILTHDRDRSFLLHTCDLSAHRLLALGKVQVLFDCKRLNTLKQPDYCFSFSLKCFYLLFCRLLERIKAMILSWP